MMMLRRRRRRMWALGSRGTEGPEAAVVAFSLLKKNV